jgi:tRNA pseudouridine55 synthase
MNLLVKDNYIEEDVLLVHKPKGITSFDVIRKLRKLLNIKKIGHAGTLDPLAHGLMIVGIGSGTKKMESYLKLPKTYLAEIIIGKSTSTGDLEGDITDQKVVYKAEVKERDIEDVLDSMLGTYDYQVPLYSAIKVEGKPLYWYARNNQEPPRIPTKEMTITNIQLLDHYPSGKEYIIKVRMSVSSGSYIRTLAEEIGKRIGYPATLKDLYRVSIDKYKDQDAYKLVV